MAEAVGGSAAPLGLGPFQQELSKKRGLRPRLHVFVPCGAWILTIFKARKFLPSAPPFEGEGFRSRLRLQHVGLARHGHRVVSRRRRAPPAASAAKSYALGRQVERRVERFVPA